MGIAGPQRSPTQIRPLRLRFSIFLQGPRFSEDLVGKVLGKPFLRMILFFNFSPSGRY